MSGRIRRQTAGADKPSGALLHRADRAKALRLFTRGLDTLAIARRMQATEAAVLKMLTLERSRRLGRPVGFAIGEKLVVHALSAQQAAGFRRLCGEAPHA